MVEALIQTITDTVKITTIVYYVFKQFHYTLHRSNLFKIYGGLILRILFIWLFSFYPLFGYT
jgi:hypothetical protein